MKILLIFLVLISGCVTTTSNTESDVSRMQFLLLPEFLAMNLAEDSYRQEIKSAEKNNKLKVILADNLIHNKTTFF